MKRPFFRKGLISALLALACTAMLPTAVTPAASTSSHGLTYLGTKKLSPRLRELSFRTKAVDDEQHVRVLLPAGYDRSTKRYPVLWLLHGGLGSHVDWTTQGHAEQITAKHPVIVVMPNGNGDGNYVDWYNHGNFGTPMWETYHMRQLLPWIDDHFRTRKTRDARAIAGLSMGGAGSTHYAARHPGLFSAVASFSGAVDTNNLFIIPITETSGLQSGKIPGSAYGPRALDEIRWRGDNATDLAENLRGMTVMVVTGTGYPDGTPKCSNPFDPVEGVVYEQGRTFHERLSELGIPHMWDAFPGCHNWDNWDRQLKRWMPLMMARFAKPQRPPSPFDFKSAEPSYPIYGWHVKIDRPAMEWSVMRNVRPNGFTLNGSGRAVVTTPKSYRPGEAVTVYLNNGATTKRRLVADRTGRVAIPLTLGPGNPYQQYSPLERMWLLTQAGRNGYGNVLLNLQKTPVYSVTAKIVRG